MDGQAGRRARDLWKKEEGMVYLFLPRPRPTSSPIAMANANHLPSSSSHRRPRMCRLCPARAIHPIPFASSAYWGISGCENPLKLTSIRPPSMSGRCDDAMPLPGRAGHHRAEETTDALKERIGDDERMRYGRAALADGGRGAALKKILHHGYQTTRSVIGQPIFFYSNDHSLGQCENFLDQILA
ncbi:hypothetical protein GPALN_014821 [Globodera pallida]|nr:hypothetical protein GPALN_014821 [Globodera pallida]